MVPNPNYTSLSTSQTPGGDVALGLFQDQTAAVTVKTQGRKKNYDTIMMLHLTF